jgi:hypothetical protein
MAGDPGLDFQLHLSGSISNAIADLSLGGTGSNVKTWTNSLTITANAPAGATRVFLNSVGSSFADAVLVFRDGNAGGFYTKMTDADVPGLWVDLLDPLPFSVAIGDKVFEYMAAHERSPFGISTAQESADGFTQYFGGYIENGSANPSGFGVYIEEQNPGPVTVEIAVSSDPTPPLLDTIPNRFTVPDLTDLMGPSTRGSFSRPLTYATRTPDFTWSAVGWIGIWVKLTSPANVRRQTDQIIALVAADSGTLRAPFILHLGAEGFTPEITLKQSPTIYIRGGARFRANVKNAETGLVVPDLPVAMRQKSGPGTFYPPAAPGETDDAGNVVGHYTAPADVGEIGQTIEIEAEV